MGRVNFLATERHYRDHLLPVWEALPAEVRGTFYTELPLPDPYALTVVASTGDYLKTRGPVIFFEHGAGFSYSNGHRSYAGGAGKDRVVLFCNTNQYVAVKNEDAYPNAGHLTVGCPKLDYLASLPAPTGKPTAGFSFHWNCKVAPETAWAFPNFTPYFSWQQHRVLSYDRLGHGHPLAYGYLSNRWDKWGISHTGEFADVLRQASVYVCDSSSTIYEFAAAGRPVVVLNAPTYRRNVNHGLRFWENIPGIQVDRWEDLHEAIEEALFRDTWAEERARITNIVYPYLGTSAQRAADAILSVL